MRLTISRQLTLMSIIIIVIFLVVGIVGNRVTQSIGGAFEYGEKNTVPAVEAISSMQKAFLELRIDGLGHIGTWNQDEKAAFDVGIAAHKKVFSNALAVYEKLASSSDDSGRMMLAADRKAYGDFLVSFDAILEQSRNNQNTEAKELFVSSKSAIDKLRESLDSHMAYCNKMATEHNEDAKRSYRRGNFLSLLSIVLGMFILSGFSFFISHSIKKRLNSMERTISCVESKLDLTVRVPVGHDDEIGKMCSALNRLFERLQGNLKTVVSAAEQLSSTAEAMFEAASKGVASSEAESVAVTKMSASMEDLTASINHIGDQSTSTRDRIANAGKLATDGEKVVLETVSDIDAIASSVSFSAKHISQLEEQSKEISKVVSVIKDVADQTNLLALNAAIEAARAGEQGRGFAVVADEVRKLAERTSRSTQEISETISVMREGAQAASTSMGDVVVQVKSSVSRGRDASATINQIGKGSREAVSMVNDITNAILEQSAASLAVAQTVKGIAQMSALATVAASDSSKTAQRLNALAQEMHGITDQYKL